jgi:hypothetical protein
LHRFHNQLVTASVAAEKAIMEFMSAFSLKRLGKCPQIKRNEKNKQTVRKEKWEERGR